MKVLTGKEVYRLAVDHSRQMTKPKAGSTAIAEPYYRASYEGITFTVKQAFYDAFVKGEIAEIVLNEGKRFAADPLNPDAPKKEIASIAFGSFATRAQLKGAASFVKELELIESGELRSVEVTDDLIAQLQKRLAPAQVAEVVGE